MDGQARVIMGEAPLTLPEFAVRIAEFARGTNTADIAVLLEPDGLVTYEHVVLAHEACLAAGIERVGVVEQAQAPASPASGQP
jgi:biopolymer transport protein ExbD